MCLLLIGAIEDSDPSYLHVDFSNKYIGGGVLGRVSSLHFLIHFPTFYLSLSNRGAYKKKLCFVYIQN